MFTYFQFLRGRNEENSKKGAGDSHFTLPTTNLGIFVENVALPTLTSSRVSLPSLRVFFVLFSTDDQQVPDNSNTDPLQTNWNKREQALCKCPIYK